MSTRRKLWFSLPLLLLLGLLLTVSAFGVFRGSPIGAPPGSIYDESAVAITGGTIDGVSVTVVGRVVSTLSFTNAASQTAFSEANMLANSAIDNQGAGEETDVILVAVSYPIKFAVETSEAFQIELCPPSGEIFTQDATALNPNDCILSSATVGSVFVVKRRQIADASWQYFTFTVQGVNTDAGAGD